MGRARPRVAGAAAWRAGPWPPARDLAGAPHHSPLGGDPPGTGVSGVSVQRPGGRVVEPGIRPSRMPRRRQPGPPAPAERRRAPPNAPAPPRRSAAAGGMHGPDVHPGGADRKRVQSVSGDHPRVAQVAGPSRGCPPCLPYCRTAVLPPARPACLPASPTLPLPASPTLPLPATPPDRRPLSRRRRYARAGRPPRWRGPGAGPARRRESPAGRGPAARNRHAGLAPGARPGPRRAPHAPPRR